MKLFIKLGFLIFTILGVNAYAEGGCPEGSYPIGGGNAGWQGCAPIPGYNSGQGQNNATQGHWEDSYGTLVFGNSKEDGSIRYAYSNNYSTEKAAIKSAFKACNDAGYVNCRKGTNFYNGFLALATGENGGIFWGIGSTEGDAKDKAIDLCKSKNITCEAFKTINNSAIWVN